jgi:hypothetical protein
MKKIVFVVVIIGLLAGAFVLRGVILGGTTQVTPNPPITADVSESLGSRPAAGGGRNDIAVPQLPADVTAYLKEVGVLGEAVF